MTDDDTREEQRQTDASNFLVGVIVLSALCSFVACSIAAIIGWLGG